MLKPGIEWGPAGVRHMLDACKASGWSHVYWRVTDGGRAMYPSKVMRAGDRWDDDAFWSPRTDADRALVQRYGMAVSDEKRTALLKKFEQMDYSQFDAFGEAVRYGHQVGLRVHAWVTINEDDHGWGLISDFARQHPECRWVKRDGTPYHSQMSFAFPQVQDYKLSMLKELLDNYELDGLFLDWIRTGDVRDNPQTDADGVANSGYERPNLDAFKSEFHQDPHDVPNADPRWVALRARPQTAFMRRARDLVRSHKRPVPISVLVGHPWHYRGLGDKIDGNHRGLLLDLPTWSREHLIDAAVPAGYYRDGGNMEKAYRALRAEIDNPAVAVWTYGWVPATVAQFESDAQVTEKVGAKHLLLWEADYIDDRPNKSELQQAMRAKSASS
jgi:uncharacterized lipoprotein YddW (UPF0748 family)